MDKLFIFLLCFYFGSAKIKINDLRVPQSIESGTVEDVILDCDYEAIDESGLVVKWFRNGDLDLIYQWIPEYKTPPQALGTIKDNIDVSYKISNDRKTMYRALHIINLSPELSGNYTCKVSGDTSEDVQTKSMVIYDPADSLSMEVSDIEHAITCEASGLYPRPELTIFINDDNDTDIEFLEDKETVELDDETRTYNVSTVLYFNPENLTGTFEYVCEVSIPGTDYKERDTGTFIFDDSGEIDSEEDIMIYATNFTELHNQTEDYLWYATDIELMLNITNSTQDSLTTTVMPLNSDTDIDNQVIEEGNRSFVNAPNIFLTLLLTVVISILRL